MRSPIVVAVCLAALALPGAAQAAVGPTNLRVTAVGAGGATLTWDAPAGGGWVYSYGIYDMRSPDQPINVGSSFTTTGTAKLRPQTRYRLAVQAFMEIDGVMNFSAFSNTVTVTTTADTTPPTRPTARAGIQTATSISLDFGGSSDDVGVDAWVISDGTRTWTQSVGQSWRFGVGGLETNRTHTFTVRARDAAGNLSAPSNALSFAIENQPPTTPTNLRVEGDELVWDASTDNAGILQYEVLVDNDPVVFAATRLTRTPLRICDDPVTPSFCFPDVGQPHTYVVRARDTSRNLSPPSAPLTVPSQ